MENEYLIHENRKYVALDWAMAYMTTFNSKQLKVIDALRQHSRCFTEDEINYVRKELFSATW